MGKLMMALGPKLKGSMPKGDMLPDEDSETPVSEVGGSDSKLDPKGNDGASPEVHAFRLFDRAKGDEAKAKALKDFISCCHGSMDGDDPDAY